jgi:hypothetical protein
MDHTHADQAVRSAVLRCRWSDLGATHTEQAGTAAALELAGCTVHATGPGPAAVTVAQARTILEAARHTRSELASARARVARAEGRPAGTLGVGQVIAPDGTVHTDPDHPTVAHIVRRRLEGASFQTIADELADDDVPTGNGGAWHRFTVQRLWRRAQVTPGRPRATVDRGQRSTAGSEETGT